MSLRLKDERRNGFKLLTAFSFAMKKESVRMGVVRAVSLKVGGCLEMCFIRVTEELETLKKLKGILIICSPNFQLLFVDY